MLLAFGVIVFTGCTSVPTVPALRETAAVHASGDAADDPAIWVAANASQSLIIASQKQGGLYVFDLAGAIVQEVPGGRPNNVDLRAGFAWHDGRSPLVGASDRSDNSIVLWRFDENARRLETRPRARIPTGFPEVYGFCLGHRGSDVIAVATNKDTGDVGVWKIGIDDAGKITSEQLGQFTLGTISEGCVVDDELGLLYVSEENVGIWRIDLAREPLGDGRTTIDRIGNNHLAADIEGLTLWSKANGAGFLIASVQGKNRYAIYERKPPNKYVGTFRIGASADGGADAVSGTDGIDATSAALGPDLPSGLLVVQDDENTAPAALQDFKLVNWAEIAKALKLPAN